MMSLCIVTSGLILSLLVRGGFCGAGNKWTYQGSLGPDHWSTDYPDCGGQNQSPIDIDTAVVKLDSNLTAFHLADLSVTENVNLILENVEGHTVEVHVTGKELNVTGGGLPGKYILDQFHFHWGGKDERGSEHTINGRHYPMEMHLVLHSSNHSSPGEAMTHEHGLAVLGFLFHVGKTNQNFEPLLKYFNYIDHSEEKHQIPTLTIHSLIAGKLDAYYRYDGSLTTPPCSETVIWSIFTKTIEVSEEQLEKFRHIKRTHIGEKEEFLIDDFRPIQPVNKRVVFTNSQRAIYSRSTRTTGSGTIAAILFLLFVSLR